MRSKKITAAVLGIVLTLGLVVSGCGNSGTSSDGSAKAETKKDGYQVVNIGFPSAGYQWAEGALAVAEEKGYLDEYLNPLGYDADLIPFTGAAPAIHEALVSGDLDYAYYAGFAGIMAKSNGIDTKLLSVTSFGSVWQLAVSTDSGITSLQDLKGKTISYQRGATPQMYVLKVLQEADAVFRDEIKKRGIESSMSHFFAVLPNVQTVGVMADHRTYDHLIAIRAVTTDDFMTADWAKIPYDVLARISDRITNEVDHVNRVVYDITSKPPGTVEWE